jgi:elongation factor Ts
MSRIPPDLVKELRRLTGASVVECRRALEASGGDLHKAASLLKLQALTMASRQPRIAGSNGVVAVHALEDGSAGGLVEVSFETRRIVRGERFRHFVLTLARQIARSPVNSLEELLEAPLPERGTRVLDALGDLILRSGEAFGIRRFHRMEARLPGVVAAYSHGPGALGRLGTLVEVSGSQAPAARRLARELTLQVSFHRPPYICRRDVPEPRLAFEREAISRRFEREVGRGSSPDALADEIMRNSFFRTAVLLDQPWVRETSRTVADLVEECSAEAGAPLRVRRYVLFEVGAPLEEVVSPEH